MRHDMKARCLLSACRLEGRGSVAGGREGSTGRASRRDRGNLGPLSFGMATLMKWEAFRRTEYAAVLLLDDDVDLFLHSAGVPPPLGTRARADLDYTWSVLYPQFLASQAPRPTAATR